MYEAHNADIRVIHLVVIHLLYNDRVISQVISNVRTDQVTSRNRLITVPDIDISTVPILTQRIQLILHSRNVL